MSTAPGHNCFKDAYVVLQAQKNARVIKKFIKVKGRDCAQAALKFYIGKPMTQIFSGTDRDCLSLFIINHFEPHKVFAKTLLAALMHT